jgi:hypothetical protein
VQASTDFSNWKVYGTEINELFVPWSSVSLPAGWSDIGFDDSDWPSASVSQVVRANSPIGLCGDGSYWVLRRNFQATPPPAGGAGAGASAVGDPHLQNVHGERFDLMKAGKHVLINIPRGTSAENALLRVQADARRLGGQCADMYFQQINVTGSWAEAKKAGGLQYSVSQQDVKTPGWLAFGNIELKVVHGRTLGGLRYLNFYVKHLSRAGFVVGGLLGEDDHQEVSIPATSCAHRMALVVGGDL